METSEGPLVVTASSIQEDTSAPMSLAAEEVVAKSTEIIQGWIDGLRSQRDKDRWMVAVTTIWEQVVHARFLFYQSLINSWIR